MKLFKLWFYFGLCSIILPACEPTEKVIEGGGGKWRLLVAEIGSSASLKLLSMPDMSVLSNDIFFEKNGIKLSGTVSKIIENRSNFYLIIPEGNKIEVIGSGDFKKVETIDFSTDQKKPSDICFASNATTAYITFSNDTTIAVLDLTNFKIARYILFGKKCSTINIAENDNQILTLSMNDNSATILDSRYNSIVKTAIIAPAPFLSAQLHGKREFIIISAGNGKFDSTAGKSSAIVSFFDLYSNNIIASKEIGFSNIKAIDVFPNSVAPASNDWAYIASDIALFKIDTRIKDRVLLLESGYFRNVTYNVKRDEVVYYSSVDNQNYLVIVDPTSDNQLSRKTFDYQFSYFLPIE